MNQKVIFITGVSSGIGEATLDALVSSGYFVVGTVRKEADKTRLESKYNERTKIVILDVRNKEQTIEVIQEIKPLLDMHGLFAIINNAGLACPGPMQYVSEEDFHSVLDVNVFAIRRLTNSFLPWLGMNKRYKPGKIVNISSVSGLFNTPFNGVYCVSKHALESLNEVYRRELLPFGISVVAVQTGPIKTPIWKKNLNIIHNYKDTEYGKMLEKGDDIITKSERNALLVQKVSETIIQILSTSNPKPYYMIHANPFLFKLIKFLPKTMMDTLILKNLQKGSSIRPI
ncbi:MAG: SDR family NAD(P)-dependent oxidoreductase [Saprospiraceae bacterium]